jgi:hypothetical protein
MRKTQPSLTDLRNGRLASKLGNQTSLKSSEILGNKSTSLVTNFYLVPSQACLQECIKTQPIDVSTRELLEKGSN